MTKNSKKKYGEVLMDAVRHSKVRQNVLQATPFVVGALLTGLFSVGYAKLFGLAEEASLSVYAAGKWLFFLVTPACFVTAWLLVRYFAPAAAGSGIPQVMAAMELANPTGNHLVDRLLSIKVAVVKVLSTMFMAVGGGIIGREGPTIQISGSIFRTVNRLLPESWPRVSKRNMIVTGAAAGLAAAFNTPLGGIVFAVEELAKIHISYFKTAIFTGVIIAGLAAQGLLGPYLYLGYPDVGSADMATILAVVPTAAICGLLAALMGVGVVRMMAWKRKFPGWKPQVLYVVVSALAIALCAYLFGPQVIGSGKAGMTQLLFAENKTVAPALPFIRIGGALLCFTSGGAGGIFAPALAIGSGIGALAAEISHQVGAHANILILSGMVAFLTGITRSPFTSAILVLEMTDRHGIVFPLMLAGLTANLFAAPADKTSLYEHLKTLYLNDIMPGNTPQHGHDPVDPEDADDA
jgi:H+/Cl- antiporter ClcA